MRTNVVLDDELLEEAQSLSGIDTKREVIHAALRLFVQHYRRKDLREIRGKVKFASNYDFRNHRERSK